MTAVRGWVEHFMVDDCGTIVRFQPLTDEARAWWDDNVAPPESWQMMGPWICVDHRPARDIAQAIAAEWPLAFH